MIRPLAALIALAAAVPVAVSAAESPVPVAVVGAPLAADAPPASVLRPVTLRLAFRVPRADTALYLGTAWYVRDLAVTIVGPGARRETIVARDDLPGRMLGLRLPAGAWEADRIELQATTVSTAAPPYLLAADQLAQIAWRDGWYAVAFGAFAVLALLLGIVAAATHAKPAAAYAVTLAAQAGLLIPWLGVVRPPPQFSQPLHALLQTIAYAGLAYVVLAAVRGRTLPRFAVPALWALVAANAVVVAGGDVLQDLWPLPDVVAQILSAALVCALAALAFAGATQRRAGTTLLFAGTVLAAAGVLAADAAPLGPLHQAGPVAGGVLEAVLLTLALFVQQRLLAHERMRMPDLDGLTGIANRTSLDDALQRAWERALRAGTPLAALLVDVDHFKAYNDAYGHHAGDDVLRRIAATLAEKAAARNDLAGRYGGEEFLVLLADTDLAGARSVASALRDEIAALEIAHGGVPSKRLSTSIGVAALVPQHRGDGGELTRRAATALHLAKSMGRNRVVVDEPQDAPAVAAG